MEAVTAVKIQIVKDSPLNDSKPRTPYANKTKNIIRKGPDAETLEVKIRKRDTMRKTTASERAILYTFIFFIRKLD